MTRISRATFPNTATQSDTVKANAFMFQRDLRSGIMPFRSRRTDSAFTVKLNPADSDTEKWLVELLKVHYGGSNLASALTRFVEDIAQYLAVRGEIYLELIPLDSNPGRPVNLAILPQGKVVHVWNTYLQIIPRPDRKPGNLPAIAIPGKRMWYLALPTTLGSPKEHRKMFHKLGDLSHALPDFARSNFGQDEGYNFTIHRKEINQAIENLTSKWGTIPSLKQISDTTEFYFIVNGLQFMRAQALIREHIFTELNNLLTKLNVPNELIVTGLPQAKDIEDAIEKLNQGQIGFAEAMAVAKLNS